MKSIKFIIILSVLFSFGACNYLDIMPDEVATEEDAFENSKAAEPLFIFVLLLHPETQFRS